MAGRKSQRLRNKKSAANKDGKKGTKVKSKKEDSKKAEPAPSVDSTSHAQAEEPQSWKTLKPALRASLLSGSTATDSDDAPPRAPKAVKLLDSDNSDTESMSAPPEIPVRGNMYQENMYERIKSKRVVNPANLTIKPKPTKKAEKSKKEEKKEVSSRRNLRSNTKENKKENAPAAENSKIKSQNRKKKGSSADKAMKKEKEEEKAMEKEANQGDDSLENEAEEGEKDEEEKVEEAARYVIAPLRFEPEPEDDDKNAKVERVETIKHRSIRDFFKPAPKRPPMEKAVNFKRVKVEPAPETSHRSVSVGTDAPYWTSALPEATDDSTGSGMNGETEQKSDKNSDQIENVPVSNLEKEASQVPETADDPVEEISKSTQSVAGINDECSSSEAPQLPAIESGCSSLTEKPKDGACLEPPDLFSKEPETNDDEEMTTQADHDAPAPVEPDLPKQKEVLTYEMEISPALLTETGPMEHLPVQNPIVDDLCESLAQQQQQFLVTENHECQEDDEAQPEQPDEDFSTNEEAVIETSDCYVVSEDEDEGADLTEEEKAERAEAMKRLLEGFDKNKLEAFKKSKKVTYSNAGAPKHKSELLVGENYLEEGMLNIRKTFDFIVVVSDDEEGRILWYTGVTRNNMQDYLLFFTAGDLVLLENIRIGIFNFRTFTVYGCKQMGIKMFQQRFTEDTLRAEERSPKNRKRKRAEDEKAKERDGGAKGRVLPELLPPKHIRDAQIRHKERQIADREAAKSSFQRFDDKTGEEIASMQFPRKIYHIVKDPSFHCIFWLGIHCDQNPVAEMLPDGSLVCTSFIINKRWAKDERQVLDNSDNSGAGILFNTQNYQSLVRQLNLYGFRKVKRSSSDPTYPGYRHALSLTKHPQTGLPSNEYDIDEFRHSFFRERSDNKVLNIKRQKPFKPTLNVWRPPKFEKSRQATARAQAREQERERVREMARRYPRNQLENSPPAGEDDKLMENNMIGHDGEVFIISNDKASDAEKITGKKRPLQEVNELDGDDPEAAFGPQGSAS